MTKRIGALFLALIPMLLLGCGASVTDVKGTVKYKDKLVKYGQVQMIGSDSVPRVSDIKDGNYKIEKVALGDAMILVTSANPAEAKDREREGERGAPVERGKKSDAKAPADWFPIPDQYGDPTRSKLKHTVVRGENTYDIKLD